MFDDDDSILEDIIEAEVIMSAPDPLTGLIEAEIIDDIL